MKKLRSNLIGIDQGSCVLFSDFEVGGEMWTGKGAREKRKTVLFNGIFRNPPSVQVTVDMWDMDRETNLRADISAAHITSEGFEIVFKTWGDTRVARIRANWVAIGEMKSEDDWDID